MSFLTYDTADDIITSLDIIEKFLFPETDFWRNNYLKADRALKLKFLTDNIIPSLKIKDELFCSESLFMKQKLPQVGDQGC